MPLRDFTFHETKVAYKWKFGEHSRKQKGSFVSRILRFIGVNNQWWKRGCYGFIKNWRGGTTAFAGLTCLLSLTHMIKPWGNTSHYPTIWLRLIPGLSHALSQHLLQLFFCSKLLDSLISNMPDIKSKVAEAPCLPVISTSWILSPGLWRQCAWLNLVPEKLSVSMQLRSPQLCCELAELIQADSDLSGNCWSCRRCQISACLLSMRQCFHLFCQWQYWRTHLQ